MSQNYITKNDLMFFQNEVFVDLKKLETLFSNKIAKLNENIENLNKEYNHKIGDFSHKIKDLLEIISETNIDHEKIEELYRNKDKIKDELNESKTRFFQFKKQIDNSLYKYDRIIIDNMEVPGLIGYNCKFNNIKEYLSFTNGELNNYKIFKTQQIGEMKIVKEKFDKLSQKLDISNKDVFQRIDLIYNNKINSFKKEIEKEFELKNELKKEVSNNQILDISKMEEEIKRNQDLNNQTKEEMKKEISSLIEEIKKNKETIDSNYITINKQKDDINLLQEQFEQLNRDIDNIKSQKIIINDNKLNSNKNIIINKNQRINDYKVITTKSLKNKGEQQLASASDLININKEKNNKKDSKNNIGNKDNIDNKDYKYNDKNNEDNKNNKDISKKKIIKNDNKDIKYIISKNENKKNKFNQIPPVFTDKDKEDKNFDNNNKTFKRTKRRLNSVISPNIKNNFEFLINDFEKKDDTNFKRKISQKLLSYCEKNHFNSDQKNLENPQKNILDLSYNSYISSSEKGNNKQNTEKSEMKKEMLNNELINEQFDVNLSKNLDINKKGNKSVSKLIKLKPIEKPIKLNLKTFNEKAFLNQENKNRNINNNLQIKEKTVNFTINTFNKCIIQNKKNITENNTNEVSSRQRKINLTDKEILENYLNNKKDNKVKDINSLSKAIHIRNYKNAFTSPNKIESKSNNIDPLFNDIDGKTSLGFNISPKNSNDENYLSNNESNNRMTSPFITTKNLSSLYRTYNNFYNKNNTNFQNNELLSGFLTSIPIRSSKNKNEKKGENETILMNKKIKKMNYKLNKINTNTKIIIKRLNLLEINYKPLNAQVNDILMILLLIYEFIKKRNINNKLNNDIFNDSNIKNHSKNKNRFFSINKPKNYLYTTNGFNLEEGGLYYSGQTKKELDLILKKIEPFLIKQFKDTI